MDTTVEVRQAGFFAGWIGSGYVSGNWARVGLIENAAGRSVFFFFSKLGSCRSSKVGFKQLKSKSGRAGSPAS